LPSEHPVWSGLLPLSMQVWTPVLHEVMPTLQMLGFVVHDASAHAFRSPGPDGDRPKHCVLCHWTRTFGPSLQSVSVAPALASRTLAVQAVDIGLFHSGAAVQPPLRAPPVPPAVDVFA